MAHYTEAVEVKTEITIYKPMAIETVEDLMDYLHENLFKKSTYDFDIEEDDYTYEITIVEDTEGDYWEATRWDSSEFYAEYVDDSSIYSTIGKFFKERGIADDADYSTYQSMR